MNHFARIKILGQTVIQGGQTISSSSQLIAVNQAECIGKRRKLQSRGRNIIISGCVDGHGIDDGGDFEGNLSGIIQHLGFC